MISVPLVALIVSWASTVAFAYLAGRWVPSAWIALRAQRNVDCLTVFIERHDRVRRDALRVAGALFSVIDSMDALLSSLINLDQGEQLDAKAEVRRREYRALRRSLEESRRVFEERVRPFAEDDDDD